MHTGDGHAHLQTHNPVRRLGAGRLHLYRRLCPIFAHRAGACCGCGGSGPTQPSRSVKLMTSRLRRSWMFVVAVLALLMATSLCVFSLFFNPGHPNYRPLPFLNPDIAGHVFYSLALVAVVLPGVWLIQLLFRGRRHAWNGLAVL